MTITRLDINFTNIHSIYRVLQAYSPLLQSYSTKKSSKDKKSESVFKNLKFYYLNCKIFRFFFILSGLNLYMERKERKAVASKFMSKNA